MKRKQNGDGRPYQKYYAMICSNQVNNSFGFILTCHKIIPKIINWREMTAVLQETFLVSLNVYTIL